MKYNESESTYTILLFYKYVHIEDPVALMHVQRELCEHLGLKGRVIIAHEGINATFEGTTENIEKYCKELISDKRFVGTHFKKSIGNGKAFPKLSVKVRKEIVSLGLSAQKDIDPNKTTGKHITPEELHEWFKSGKKFKIIDMRNDYEHKVGHFKNSILPPLQNFRDLPKALKELEPLKDEVILTVCTGGVRCEKASGYLVKNGFKNVHQLYGGIVSYMEKYETGDSPAQNFQGSLYVFDNRVTMAFAESKNRPVKGLCSACGVPAETYINCADPLCHKHLIVCKKCQSEDTFCPEGDHVMTKKVPSIK